MLLFFLVFLTSLASHPSKYPGAPPDPGHPRYLIEYVNSHDGKPIGPNTPYLCPEARWQVQPGAGGNTMNISQISYEWPATFLDVVEWQQHQNKSGVFFHEEGVFSLWTMKVMDIDPTKHMVFFLCIDYSIWPG